mgnify:CR=1 FL=1
MCSPPVLKDMVDPHVESLRRGRIFCEGITDIGTVDALVREGAKSEEEAQAGLFHAGGVGVVKSTNLATTSRTVTDATGLFGLGFVGLDVVRPHPIEDGGIRRSGDRVSEHTLLSKLVVLLILVPDMVELVEVELGDAFFRGQIGADIVMRERETGSLVRWLPYGGNRLLNVIDGMDWEAIDGDKEGVADAAAP